MKVVTYNIQFGVGRDGRHDLARIAGELTGADVIALQEVDRFWQRTGMVDGPAVLSRLLPAYHWMFNPTLDLDASITDANGTPIHRRRQFGTLILSRWPILTSRSFPLPKIGTLSLYAAPQALHEVTIQAPGFGLLRIYNTHLSHLCTATRLPQVEAIMDRLAQAMTEGGVWCQDLPHLDSEWCSGRQSTTTDACILLGDLNFGPGDPEYDRMVGPLAPRFGRLNHRAGLIDAWPAAGHEETSGLTHPLAGKRIDHCLVSPSLADRVRAAWIDTAAQGSDHIPLWVDLQP